MRPISHQHPSHQPTQRLPSNEAGFVFFAVLLVMVVLIAVGLMMFRLAESEQLQSANFVRYMRARTAAETGVDQVLSAVPPGTVPSEPVRRNTSLDDGRRTAFEAVAQALPAGISLPGTTVSNATETLFIQSIGTTGGTANTQIKQQVTTIVDNSRANPRVLLWMIETPAE